MKNQSDQSIANSFLSRLANSKSRIKVFSTSLFVKYCIPYKSHKMYHIVPYNMKCRQMRPFGTMGSPMGYLSIFKYQLPSCTRCNILGIYEVSKTKTFLGGILIIWGPGAPHRGLKPEIFRFYYFLT